MTSRKRIRIPKAGLAAVGLLVLAAMVLAACGGGSSGSSGSTESSSGETGGLSKDTSATLHVAAWENWYELPIAAEQLEKEFPNVDVKFEAVSETYFNNLPQTLKTSDVPDVTATHTEPGISPWSEILKENLLLDLSNVWSADGLESAYEEGTADLFFNEAGAPVALPMHVVWAPVVYYNEEIFEEAGIEPPAGPVPTSDEWNMIVSKLEEKGVIPMVPEGVATESGAAFLLGSLVQSSCGEEEYLNLIENWQAVVKPTTTWTSDCVVAAITELSEWADSGVFGSAAATLSGAQANSLFSSKQAAMIAGGSWQGLAPLWKEDLKVGWFLPPGAEGGAEDTKFSIAETDGLSIPANAENVELAEKFVEIVGSKQFQGSSAYLKAPGLSPRQDVEPKGLPPVAASQVAARGEVGSVPMMLLVPYAAQVVPVVAKLIAGETSPEDIANELAKLNEEATE